MRSTFPGDHFAKNVTVKFPVPQNVSGVSFSGDKAGVGSLF